MSHEFPGYRALERLHAGPRSTVDRAVRLADDRTVIVKQPTGQLVAAEALARLHHELEVLRAVRGPGVIEALEVIRDGSRAALVVEDFGSDLASALAGRRFSLGEALDVAAAAAAGLARIHAAGVVHRDVNPSNLLYDPSTRGVKLIDFDFASRNAGARPESAAGEGTLHYLAPEQTGRLERAVDERSDLYALGITLYELFTGQRPFGGDNALALIHAHLAEQPRRIDELDPQIPAVIADIACKLIAKAPEQRYQSAAGVLADLERCRRELADEGRIAPFAIARHDAAPRLELPDRLYGREPEVRALLDAFERTAHGGVETVLVSGYSGIGKTSVVRELVAPVTARRGYLASGKFEQLNRDVPYNAVVAAVEQLFARILAEPAIERWAIEIAIALGDDASLARSVLPAIERVLGPLPPAPPLPPEIAGRRLALAMSRLIQVFARKPHPLVLFLDDMQWADKASLQLLTELATSERTESLLVIEAYRDNEVDEAHPLAAALRAHTERGARLTRIELRPLTLDETAELVADTLRLSTDAVRDAAAVVWRKTEGNPFFVRQFVQALYDDGCIAFDPGARAFTLDVAAVGRVAITENVADLLARQLGKLPDDTRSVLVIAAAVGTEFDIATLATVAVRSAAELQAALAPAVDAGLIAAAFGQPQLGRYRFQHDRIQQAAYEAAPAPARERIHLMIGRQLLSAATGEELDARLFEIVHHLHRGLPLIIDEAERTRFTELAMASALRARRSGAFDVAAAALRAVVVLRDWRHHHATAFTAHLELARALSLDGQHREARDVVHAAYPHTTDRERATLGALEIALCAHLGLFPAALACGRRAAALLGVELPGDPTEIQHQVEGDLAAILAAVAERPIERWIDLPAMTDPAILETATILIHCTAPAYQCEPALMALLASKLVALSLHHGNCSASPHGYAALAITLWGMGHQDAGFRFGKLAVDVAHRLGAQAQARAPSVEYIFAAFAAPWRLPLDECIALLRATVARAVEAGDLVYAGFAISEEIAYRMIHGERLDDVIESARDYRTLCRRLGLHDIGAVLGWHIAHAQTWTGAPPAPDEPAIDFAAVERWLISKNRSRTALALFRILEIERRYWAGDPAGVLELAQALGPINESSPGSLYNAEVRLYAALSAIAVDPTGAYAPLIAAYRDDLARYAGANPAGFRHMAALVDAELARVSGGAGAAIAMYDAAIDSAAEHGFVKLEAIAHELAAGFWIERAKPAFAAVHLGKARDLYHHWGARARVREIELRRRRLGATSAFNDTSRSTSAITSTLDFATVLKASQALATDMVLDSLLARMMEIIIENTGAQTGSIVLDHGGLFVHASKAPNAEISVGGPVPLASAPDLSAGIVSYAMRTSECIVLGDATRHPTFRSDPYVRERRPRSVLCLPIAHKERMIGAIYLENNLVADAFTVERLDALGVLVAQLAVSIENAMIFARLEDLVAERTRALTEANHQLRVQSLARERMESQLRLAQKLQSVGQLAAGIAHEINTPMQYIGDNAAFLDDALRSLLTLVDAYRAAIAATADPATAAGVQQLEEELDLEYLRGNASEACTNAREGVQRVSQIVTAMKTFSHPDQREQSPVSLAAALENTLVVAQNEYRHIADVVTDFADLPEVLCHRGELNQVFLNLIVNAAHAIKEVVKQRGGRGTIAIRTRRDGPDTVVIAISDTGGGIPEAIRDRVFDPFFTTKDVGHGTGQGLALARTAIVDRHGGTISFETQLGEGTTFLVRLPIRGWSATHVAAAS